ncbi:MAG: creatininase family protein [bacterium]|nr:creatininase family protein [bacterium]
MTAYRFEHLFPAELEARIAAQPVVVLSFGTLEWHSHHLPLGLDGLVASAVGERIADRLDAVLVPVSYWAAGGVPYPYTLKLPISVIEPLLTSVFEQLSEMGFRVIVAFTGHFGIEQTLTLKRAAYSVMSRSPVTILPVTSYDLISEHYTGDHAGIGETSLMAALQPDLVRLDAVPASTPLDGVLGADPREIASAEKGAAMLTQITAVAEVTVTRLLHQSPVERARYHEVCGLLVRVLAKTFEQRQQLPKALVPSITTPAYLRSLQALYSGQYEQAKQAAEAKLADLKA